MQVQRCSYVCWGRSAAVAQSLERSAVPTAAPPDLAAEPELLAEPWELEDAAAGSAGPEATEKKKKKHHKHKKHRKQRRREGAWLRA